MKSAIFALLASTSAVQISESPWTQTPNPKVISGMGGMAGPRICEMGATNDDVGFSGCEHQTKYTPPVRSIRRAQYDPAPPIGGAQKLREEGNNQKVEGPNTTPRAGRGGAVYIPFPIGQKTQPSLAQMQSGAFESPWTQTPTPDVPVGMGGMAGPRICEQGAEDGNVGFQGCLPQTKYTVPVISGKRAVRNPPIGGARPKGWEPASGPNTFPQAGRGGNVYIPFAYAQQPRFNQQQFAQMQFMQMRAGPSLSDQEEANYQKVYDAEQTRLKQAEKDLRTVIKDEEALKSDSDVDYRAAHSKGLAPLIGKGANVV